MILAFVSDEILYSFLANAFYILTPLLLYSAVQLISSTHGVLQSQWLIGYFNFIVVAIADTVILAELVLLYRYCYGDLNEYCVDSGTDYDLECREEYRSGKNDNEHGKEINCEGELMQIVVIFSIALNAIASLISIPYLAICERIRVLEISNENSTEEENNSFTLLLKGRKVDRRLSNDAENRNENEGENENFEGYEDDSLEVVMAWPYEGERGCEA